MSKFELFKKFLEEEDLHPEYWTWDEECWREAIEMFNKKMALQEQDIAELKKQYPQEERPQTNYPFLNL